jgi:hypothetical protein
MAWDKHLDLILDTGKRVEPLLAVDTNSLWQRVKLEPLVQGSIYSLTVAMREFTANGAATAITTTAGDTMTVCGMRRNQTGDVLFSNVSLTRGTNSFTGLLSLHTLDLDEAMSDYPSIQVRMEIVLANSSGTTKYRWLFDTTVERKNCADTPPVVPGGPTYYNTDEADAIFARKDGPTGYAVKLVTHEGSLYWAQLVGTAWVINKIVQVGGVYTNTYIEVA